MCSTDCVDDNVDQLLKLLRQALRGGARLISFPENSLYLRIDMENGEKYAFAENSQVFERLALELRGSGAQMHLGSVPVKLEGEIRNVSVWIDDQGQVNFPYSKMHLFDIELHGQKPIRESDYYRKGTQPALVKTLGFRFGLSICYDLRFPELFLYYAHQGVDALMIPAAFLVETGRAHWEVLLRARAIEGQSYVVAAAQGGTHVSKNGKSRQTYGHTMIVDPWGAVLAQADADKKVVFADISGETIRKVRAQIPMAAHRRFHANWSWT